MTISFNDYSFTERFQHAPLIEMLEGFYPLPDLTQFENVTVRKYDGLSSNRAAIKHQREKHAETARELVYGKLEWMGEAGIAAITKEIREDLLNHGVYSENVIPLVREALDSLVKERVVYQIKAGNKVTFMIRRSQQD